MPLTISDDVLRQLGLTEQGAKIEFACRMFDGGRMTLAQAGRFAGLTRAAIEDELLARGISIYRPTPRDLQHDLDVLKRMGI